MDVNQCPDCAAPHAKVFIDDRLSQLQAIARERGSAIATATAFPVTIERVAAFIKAAANKGIAIVPVSAMVATHSSEVGVAP